MLKLGSFLFSPFLQVFGVVVFIFAFIAIIYGRGRNDAANDIERKSNAKYLKKVRDAAAAANDARRSELRRRDPFLRDKDGN